MSISQSNTEWDHLRIKKKRASSRIVHDVVVNGLRRLGKVDICVLRMEVVRMNDVDSMT